MDPKETLRIGWLRIGLGVVYLLALLVTFPVRGGWVSLLAPLAGPWAGHLYGHGDCTMASVLPATSMVAAAALPLALLVAIKGRRRALAGLPLLLWFVAWSALAWMSAVNSTS